MTHGDDDRPFEGEAPGITADVARGVVSVLIAEAQGAATAYEDPSDEIRQCLQIIACDGGYLAEVFGGLSKDAAASLESIAKAAARINGVCVRGIVWRKP